MSALVYLDTMKQMPLMALPVRTVVVPLSNARVMLSPGSKLTEGQLASAGEVTDIVAPSLLHTAGMAAAAKAFPKARLWGPRGVKKRHPELAWKIVGEDAWPYDAELKLIPVAGVERLRELVFLHRPTRSLLVADLVFNMTEARGLGPRIILGLFGTWKKLGISKFFLRFRTDPAAFRASLESIAGEDFDRLVPSHGAAVERGGKEAFLAAMRERGLA